MSATFYIKEKSIYLHYRKTKEGRKADLRYYPNLTVTNPEKDWLQSAQRLRESAIDQEAIKTNKKLKAILAAVETVTETHDVFKMTAKDFGRAIDQELLDKKMGRKKGIQTPFFKYCDRFYEEKSGVKAKPQESDPEAPTIKVKPTALSKALKTKALRAKSITTTINLLREFQPRLSFEDITVKFAREFVRFMQSERKDGNGDVKYHSKNYIQKTIAILKRIVVQASEEDESIPLHILRFKFSGERVKNVYLTEEMIEKIYYLPINREAVIQIQENPEFINEANIERQIEALERARKLLVIGCWTGMRVSDYLKINPNIQIQIDRQGKHIRAITSKTQAEVRIPLHWMIKEIAAEGWPETISDVKFNKQIKHLGLLAGFTHPVQWGRTEGGVGVVHTEPFYKMIKSHTCRRSLATNLILRGFSVPSVMSITGHKTEHEFWKYVCVTPEQISGGLAGHEVWNKKPEPELV